MAARPTDAAQYKDVTTSKVIKIARGTFFDGSFASPEMQQISKVKHTQRYQSK